jgi:hypothetical protein
MTTKIGVIADAGPVLTFLARKEWTRILYTGLRGKPFAVPATVEREVLRIAKRDRRFAAVSGQWTKLRNADKIVVLSDDVTSELDRVVARIDGTPLAQRLNSGKDLGELMVISHAVVLAEQAQTVTVIIQEGNGTALARREASRLSRIAAGAESTTSSGALQVWSVDRVLQAARSAGCPQIPDQTAMKKLWADMRGYDDALPPIGQTSLLAPDL